MAFAQTILAFLVALGVLVTIHEFGHFWVARKVGVKILRFSVGFGKPIWSTRRGPDATEFTLAAIPLGGYVKMLDEREGSVADDLRHRAFNNQSLRDRSAIVLAGPCANFVFALFAYWAMYMVGVTGPTPIIGEVKPDSLAATAGLRPGEVITQINGEASPTWDNVFRTAVSAILDDDSITLSVANEEGREREVVLDLNSVTVDALSRGEFFERVGFQPYRPAVDPVIGRVVADGPADRAGIMAGDRILAANGQAIDNWMSWVENVRANPGAVMDVRLERADQIINVALTPQTISIYGKASGRICAEVYVSGISPIPTGI
jgi:regulator of sigma E protease